MRSQKNLIIVIVFIVVFCSRVVRCDSISNVRLSPSLPASLSHGEEIQITFKYSTNYTGGVRIWPRPMTGGQRSSNYAASGSPLYAAGTGSGSGHFTIRSGDVFVDAIRFEIRTEDKDSSGNRRLLHEQTIPVRYRFSDDPFRGVIVKRYLRPDGVIEIRNADGTVTLHSPDGKHGYLTADGEEQWVLPLIAAITKPEPPTLVSEADAEWIEHLNKWLEEVGVGLLESIEQLAGDPSSFQNYKQYEDNKCQTLYQRIEMRQTFLRILVKEQ
jgi:hypothetical protein